MQKIIPSSTDNFRFIAMNDCIDYVVGDADYLRRLDNISTDTKSLILQLVYSIGNKHGWSSSTNIYSLLGDVIFLFSKYGESVTINISDYDVRLFYQGNFHHDFIFSIGDPELISHIHNILKQDYTERSFIDHKKI